MKKIYLVPVVLLAALAAVCVAPHRASAAADIIRFDGYYPFDANGVENLSPDMTCKQVTSNSGQVNIKCSGPIWPGGAVPQQAMQFTFASTGVPCGTSTDWQQTLTPNGKVEVVCKIH